VCDDIWDGRVRAEAQRMMRPVEESNTLAMVHVGGVMWIKMRCEGEKERRQELHPADHTSGLGVLTREPRAKFRWKR